MTKQVQVPIATIEALTTSVRAVVAAFTDFHPGHRVRFEAYEHGQVAVQAVMAALDDLRRRVDLDLARQDAPTVCVASAVDSFDVTSDVLRPGHPGEVGYDNAWKLLRSTIQQHRNAVHYHEHPSYRPGAIELPLVLWSHVLGLTSGAGQRHMPLLLNAGPWAGFLVCDVIETVAHHLCGDASPANSSTPAQLADGLRRVRLNDAGCLQIDGALVANDWWYPKLTLAVRYRLHRFMDMRTRSRVLGYLSAR